MLSWQLGLASCRARYADRLVPLLRRNVCWLIGLIGINAAFLARRSAADSSASANFLKMDFFLMVAMVLISSSSGIEPKRFNSRSRREVIPPAIARWQEPYVGGGRKTRPEMGGDKYSPETKYLL